MSRTSQLEDALRELLTRVQMEMRTGKLPHGWADPTIYKARRALDPTLPPWNLKGRPWPNREHLRAALTEGTNDDTLS